MTKLRRRAVAFCAAVLLPFVAPIATADGIIAGTPAGAGDWPWTVAVLHDDAFVCGGALLSTEAAVTASHCFPEVPGKVEVMVGSVTLGEGTRLVASSVVDHPTSDLSVILLEDALSPDAEAFAIELATVDDYGADDQAWVTGWGGIDRDDPKVVTELQQVSVPLVSDAACTEVFPLQFDAPAEICAGGGGAGSCLGDSGGPLMTQRADGAWVLVGVVSRSALPCADPGSPTIYTEVAPLAEWMRGVFAPSPPADKAPAPSEPDLEDQPVLVDDTTPTDVLVITGYTDSEFETLAAASTRLGMGPGEVQKAGVYVLRFLTALSGVTDPQPLAAPPQTDGTRAVESAWAPHEVEALQWSTAHYGTNEAQAQKLGATLLSFLSALAG